MLTPLTLLSIRLRNFVNVALTADKITTSYNKTYGKNSKIPHESLNSSQNLVFALCVVDHNGMSPKCKLLLRLLSKILGYYYTMRFIGCDSIQT